MISDAKWRFKTSGGSEDLATSGTTEVTSDYIGLVAGGYADGGSELVARVRVKSTTAAVGASFNVAVMECATSGGTYTVAVQKTVPLASVIAGTEIAALRLPLGLKKFIELVVTPAASTTGALTVNAGIFTS